MRELKFRAWDKNHGMSHPFGVARETAVWPDQFYSVIYPKEMPVMQYTGLKDKNGREIFEGDVLLNDGEGSWAGVVVYEDGEWRVKCNQTGDYDPLTQTYMHEKVIGNIYEDSHLLEAK